MSLVIKNEKKNFELKKNTINKNNFTLFEIN